MPQTFPKRAPCRWTPERPLGPDAQVAARAEHAQAPEEGPGHSHFGPGDEEELSARSDIGYVKVTQVGLECVMNPVRSRFSYRTCDASLRHCSRNATSYFLAACVVFPG